MNGLRVYINPSGEDAPGGHAMFYSRRADGPYYCWFYEEHAGQWQVRRAHPLALTPKALRVARWKVIPPELQASISEHYLE